MKILNWLLGYRKQKAQDNPIPQAEYNDKPYFVSKHAVSQMNNRSISKGAVHTNLHTKPIHKTKIKVDKFGRPSYNRSSENKITTSINPKTKTVVTVHKLHSKDYAKYKNKRR